MNDTPQLAKLTRPRLKGAVARKTTLVGSYLEARALPHLWYQLDAGDGDVATWFHYLEIAAQCLAPHHPTPLPRFTPDHLPSLGLFTQRFFEALFARFTPASVLVLDNYQDVPPDSPLHALLADALAQVPHGVNVVIVSRAEPPAAYARLRANGAVAWLDYEQLKLTHAEASAIVTERTRTHASKPANDHDVTPECIEKICAITHGWAAGLTLLLERGRSAGVDLPLSGNTPPQVVFDYFAGEVFQRLDAAQRNIIVQAALLPDMDAGAVRDLTGDARGPDVLANLARRNYFTQVLARRENQSLALCEGPTYRFHPLFRAFLLNQAQHVFTAQHLTDLQRRAARVLEDRGNTEDAIDLSHQAGDWDNAARLIVARARVGHERPSANPGNLDPPPARAVRGSLAVATLLAEPVPPGI